MHPDTKWKPHHYSEGRSPLHVLCWWRRSVSRLHRWVGKKRTVWTCSGAYGNVNGNWVYLCGSVSKQCTEHQNSSHCPGSRVSGGCVSSSRRRWTCFCRTGDSSNCIYFRWANCFHALCKTQVSFPPWISQKPMQGQSCFSACSRFWTHNGVFPVKCLGSIISCFQAQKS